MRAYERVRCVDETMVVQYDDGTAALRRAYKLQTSPNDEYGLIEGQTKRNAKGDFVCREARVQARGIWVDNAERMGVCMRVTGCWRVQ